MKTDQPIRVTNLGAKEPKGKAKEPSLRIPPKGPKGLKSLKEP